jgi:hypothetical protein
MPDMYDDLVTARPVVASEMLPTDTHDLVVSAVHRARRRRILSMAGVGTIVALVAGFALWQGIPRAATPDMAGTPTAASPSPSLSSSPAASATQRAVVVLTPTPLTATIEPRPLANRRVARGALLLQVDGGPLVLCAGPVADVLPPQCSGNVITGVSWDQIPWKMRGVTTTWAVVDVVGVLGGTGMSSPLAVEQIGPLGTFVVTSDSPAPDLTMPAMACLRSSDQGGFTFEAKGIETVSGYQAAWINARGFNLATVADPATVEIEVRALGYQGPLCIGTLPGPAHSELVAAQQSVVSLDGVWSTSIAVSDSVHLEVGVVASTPAVVDQIQALIRAKSPTASVVVTPAFLTIA